MQWTRNGSAGPTDREETADLPGLVEPWIAGPRREMLTCVCQSSNPTNLSGKYTCVIGDSLIERELLGNRDRSEFTIQFSLISVYDCSIVLAESAQRKVCVP